MIELDRRFANMGIRFHEIWYNDSFEGLRDYAGG